MLTGERKPKLSFDAVAAQAAVCAKAPAPDSDA